MNNSSGKPHFFKSTNNQVDSASSLEWIARNLAKGLHLGKHHSSKIGVGMEFNQFRNYVQGDDIRLLDWKMYAKTQQHFIRQSDIETNHGLHVSIDRSTSMDYAEGGQSKIMLAKIITATLTYLMAQQSDQFSWKSGSTTFTKSQGLKNWRRSVIELDRLQSDRKSNETNTSNSSHQRGIHLWITDLYLDIEEFKKHLMAHDHPHNEMVVFHLIGRKEESLNFEKNTKFIDLETGQEMQVNAPKFQQTYKEALGAHLLQIKRICQKQGVFYRKIYLDSDLKNELERFLFDYKVLKQ